MCAIENVRQLCCLQSTSIVHQPCGKALQPKGVHSKGVHFFSLLSGNIFIAKKTIKAHPINSSLLGVATVVSLVALVRLGLGQDLSPEESVALLVSITVGGLALFRFFWKYRINAEIEHMNAHALENIVPVFTEEGIPVNLDRKVCLYILTPFNRDFGLERYQFLRVDYTLKKECILIHAEISTPDELIRAIQTTAQMASIKLLWIVAHGNPHIISLGSAYGENETINKLNIHNLKEALSLLAPDATIVLRSCSTGGTPPEEPNIARKLSEMAPGRRVIAPSSKIWPDSIILKQKKGEIQIGIQPYKCQFKEIKLYPWEWRGYFLLDRFIPSCLVDFRQDIMTIYRDGQKQDGSTFVPLFEPSLSSRGLSLDALEMKEIKGRGTYGVSV